MTIAGRSSISMCPAPGQTVSSVAGQRLGDRLGAGRRSEPVAVADQHRGRHVAERGQRFQPLLLADRRAEAPIERSCARATAALVTTGLGGAPVAEEQPAQRGCQRASR